MKPFFVFVLRLRIAALAIRLSAPYGASSALSLYLLSFRYGSAALHLHVSQSVTARLRADRQVVIGLVGVPVDIT